MRGDGIHYRPLQSHRCEQGSLVPNLAVVVYYFVSLSEPVGRSDGVYAARTTESTV